MGHDFLRIRGVKYLTYGPMGKSQMSMRKPIKLSTTFLVFFPNHLFLPECGWVSYCMEWEEYGKRNSNWAETHFWKTCFDFLGKEKCPKMYDILLCSHVFSFSSPFSFTLGFLGAAGVFPVSFIPRFWLLASFFPWIGGRFCSARDWVVFLTFWELLVHFSIHVFVASCVFTMAMKGHSRFDCLTD